MIYTYIVFFVISEVSYYFRVSFIVIFFNIATRVKLLITRGYGSIFSWDKRIWVTQKKGGKAIWEQNHYRDRWRRLRWRCSYLVASNLSSTYTYYLIENIAIYKVILIILYIVHSKRKRLVQPQRVDYSFYRL